VIYPPSPNYVELEQKLCSHSQWPNDWEAWSLTLFHMDLGSFKLDSGLIRRMRSLLNEVLIMISPPWDNLSPEVKLFMVIFVNKLKGTGDVRTACTISALPHSTFSLLLSAFLLLLVLDASQSNVVISTPAVSVLCKKTIGSRSGGSE